MASQGVPAGVGGWDKAMSAGRGGEDRVTHWRWSAWEGDCSRNSAAELGLGLQDRIWSRDRGEDLWLAYILPQPERLLIY